MKMISLETKTEACWLKELKICCKDMSNAFLKNRIIVTCHEGHCQTNIEDVDRYYALDECPWCETLIEHWTL